MFISKADLKSKAKPKGTATATRTGRGTAGVNTGKVTSSISVVEQARIEREARSLRREHTNTVLKIQSCFRSYTVRSKTKALYRGEFDKKVEDITKLSTLLKSSKGVIFSAPGDVCLHLVRLLCFGKFHKAEDILRWVALSEILSRNLMSNDVDKSFAFVLVNFKYLIIKLFSRIFEILCDTCARGQGFEVEGIPQIAACLSRLNGSEDGKQHRSTNRPIEEAFAGIRTIAIDVCVLFTEVRSTLLNYTRSMLRVVDEEDYGTQSRCRSNPEMIQVVDTLFGLSLFLIGSDASAYDQRLSLFCVDLMTVPFITQFLSGDMLRQFTSSESFSHALSFCRQPALCLPSSEHTIFQSGHFMLGNFCNMSIYVDVDARAELGGKVDVLFENYLSTCSSLIQRFYVPGVFQGQSGVLWNRDGAVLAASGVPLILRYQILCLLDRDFLQAIYLRYFNFNFVRKPSSSRKEDEKEVNDALSSSSIEVARASMERSVQEASSWGISSWFSKLNSSLSSAFSFKGSNESEAPTAGRESSIERHSEFILMKLKSALDAIFGLWVLILPQATSSSSDSLPWRSLTNLVFSTPLLEKLWSMSTFNNIHDMASTFEASKNLQLGDDSMIFILIATLLKISLVVLDDSELYELGRPAKLVEFIPLIKYYKSILYKCLNFDAEILVEPKFATNIDPVDMRAESTEITFKLFKYHSLRAMSFVLDNLHTRWSRRPFSSSKLWVVDETETSRVLQELRRQTPFSISLLRIMPWSISFYERMKLFRGRVDHERMQIQGVDNTTGIRARGNVIRVRRSRLLEDGKEALDKIGSIKDRIVVRYVNEIGQEEIGIGENKYFIRPCI